MYKGDKGTSIINVILTILIFICITFITFSIIEESDNKVADNNETNESGSALLNKIKRNETSEKYYQNVELDNSIEGSNDKQVNDSIRYYYNQLNNTGKKLYDTIVDNVEAFENGKEEIEFDIKTENAGEFFQSAWDAFILDKPEVFWVDTTKVSWTTRTLSSIVGVDYKYTLSPKDGETYFLNSFNTEEEVKEAIDKVNNKIEEIASNAKGSRYEKVQYVHDFLVDSITYDQTGKINNSNLYGALIENLCVCEGYAEAFKAILNELDIPCVIVYGDGIDARGNTESHAWNYVKMEDGKWYAVDTTWDDPIIVGSGNITGYDKHKYLLKGSENFSDTHIPDGDVSGTGQNFSYPELSINDYNA